MVGQLPDHSKETARAAGPVGSRGRHWPGPGAFRPPV
eukprot:gene44305-59106_t